MKRKIEDYKNQKVAIYCSTQEKWDKIIDLFPLNKNVKKFHWQGSVNNGKSDTINISGNGWSLKKHFEDKGYTIYPASDFLEEKPFKFNIEDEIKAKPGGYYICSPEHFTESHKEQFPSEKSTISGKITERTQAQGFNWYRCGHGNWITEEGIEIEVKSKSLVGRYVKALRNINTLKKGDYDLILSEDSTLFQCEKSFSWSKSRFEEGDFELMPEGFKPEEEINTYGLKVGDTLKQEIINAWAYFQGNFCPDVQKGWVEVFDSYGKDRKIEDFRNIDGQIGFHVSECTKESHYLKAEGFKEFADNFYKKEILEMLPYPKDNYFKAVVVKDIHKKDITIKGYMPDLIPKGYQTWFRDVDTYYRENIFQNKEVVCPEENRWAANIPAEYFEIVEEKESGMLVFGKYKVGDVVVSLEQKAPYRVVGDMFEVLKSSGNALYYLYNTCSLTSKEWRAATEEEIKAFQQGIKNVNDIPKKQWIPKYKIGDIFKGLIGEVTITEIGKFKEKAYRLNDNKCFDTEEYVDTLKCLSNEWTPKIGDYVVITKGTNNWSSTMNQYIGKVAKLTSCLSYDKNTFRIDLDNGDWEWQLKHNHFRKAEPDEIPLKQTTMSMQEIQQICKEKYPIGCKYKCVNFNYEYILLQDDFTYTIVNNEIWASCGKGCLYSNGKYAELISLPKSDWNPQIGDHVIIISPKEKNNWVSGMDKYVGKLAKITKKREDTFFEIDLDNAYYVWDYKPHRKFFRKAEPHEISTISKSFEFFKEGDKVLIKDGCEYYRQGIDSIGEKMIGIISNVNSTSLPFTVKWSNENQNSYNKEHLEHYVEMTSSKSISPTMLEIAKSKYPLGTFYIDSYERKQEVKGILTIEKDIITDGWGGAVYEKGKWAKIVDALYNDNKSEQKTSTSENYPLPPTKSVTKKKREIILVPLIQPKTVKVFDREENFF